MDTTQGIRRLCLMGRAISAETTVFVHGFMASPENFHFQYHVRIMGSRRI
jgi:hypothetical protein